MFKNGLRKEKIEGEKEEKKVNTFSSKAAEKAFQKKVYTGCKELGRY